MKLSSWFFSPKIGFYSVGIRVSGATRLAQPTRAHLGGGDGTPWCILPSQGPPLVVLGSSIFYLL